MKPRPIPIQSICCMGAGYVGGPRMAVTHLLSWTINAHVRTDGTMAPCMAPAAKLKAKNMWEN